MIRDLKTGRFLKDPRFEQVKRICKTCGKQFEILSSEIKKRAADYCSKKCYFDSLNKNIILICHFCNKKFTVKFSRRNEAKFCSHKCYAQFLKSNVPSHLKNTQFKKGNLPFYPKTNDVTLICQYCNKSFIRNEAYIARNPSKYCSLKCANQVSWKNVAGYWTGKKQPEEMLKRLSILRKGKIPWNKQKSIFKICKICGKKFKTHNCRKDIAKYCSYKCAGIANSRYNRGEKNWNWKGGKCNIKKRLWCSLKYQQWRQQVYLRDNFTCQKCGIKGGKLHAHHKKSVSKLIDETRFNLPLLDLFEAIMLYTPFWNLDNGQTLCIKCHKKTKNYGKNKKTKGVKKNEADNNNRVSDRITDRNKLWRPIWN